jgi:hypothetical protein
MFKIARFRHTKGAVLLLGHHLEVLYFPCCKKKLRILITKNSDIEVANENPPLVGQYHTVKNSGYYFYF